MAVLLAVRLIDFIICYIKILNIFEKSGTKKNFAEKHTHKNLLKRRGNGEVAVSGETLSEYNV